MIFGFFVNQNSVLNKVIEYFYKLITRTKGLEFLNKRMMKSYKIASKNHSIIQIKQVRFLFLCKPG